MTNVGGESRPLSEVAVPVEPGDSTPVRIPATLKISEVDGGVVKLQAGTKLQRPKVKVLLVYSNPHKRTGFW